MTAADRNKWDARYRAGSYSERTHPTALLERHISSFNVGRALDIACGAGRNSLYLASLGYRVDGVDISEAALERARSSAAERDLHLHLTASDLDHGLPDAIASDTRYDLIVVVRYVNTKLVKDLCNLLAPGGALVCEEHLVSAEDVAGPSTPAWRVGPGELLEAARSLDIRFYREGLILDPDGRRVSLAQLIATRGGSAELDYC